MFSTSFKDDINKEALENVTTDLNEVLTESDLFELVRKLTELRLRSG